MIAESWYLVPMAAIIPFTQERIHADRILNECLTDDDPNIHTTMAQEEFSERKAERG